eukprot:TRINITY_DN6978_c0_g1_i1.p1 TRINITY_DN6978_c0_g1~~TRINITY_DN6978_c0_g1_i1.p1  ORF type:complete len:194 (-),score=43.73 TRINITY_DN6978_c0_g1_i1:170-751(-)
MGSSQNVARILILAAFALSLAFLHRLSVIHDRKDKILKDENPNISARFAETSKDDTIANSTQPYFFTVPSQYAFANTVALLRNNAESFNLTVTSTVDHRTQAAKFGITIRPNTVTLVMNSAQFSQILSKSQVSAIEFPIQIVCFRDRIGATNVAYVNAFYIRDNFGIGGIDDVFIAMDQQLKGLVRVASGSAD